MEEKPSRLILPLCVCLVITLLMGAALIFMDFTPFVVPEGTTAAPGSGAESKTPSPSLDFVLDLSAYESAMNPADRDAFLTLVNKTHLASGTPENLVTVRDANRSLTLDATAEAALHAMFLEMQAQGIEGVFVTSAYRSYEYQVNLFNGYIEKEMAADKSLSYQAAREKVLRYSAAPGTSEHQTGLCVDLMTVGMQDLDETFENYPVFAWLSDNAWKFGFILRFPKGKEALTGYDYEPWHYRFVGRYHAEMIHNAGLCFEEYSAER